MQKTLTSNFPLYYFQELGIRFKTR